MARTDYNGTYSEYRSGDDFSFAAQTDTKEDKPPSAQAVRFQDAKEKKKQLKKVERTIEELQSEKKKIMDWFLEGHTDLDESQRKNIRLKEIEARIASGEEEWFVLAAELEDAME